MTPDCQTCGDEGVIYVMGQSVNPYSGTKVYDPQIEHEEPCPECHPRFRDRQTTARTTKRQDPSKSVAAGGLDEREAV